MNLYSLYIQLEKRRDERNRLRICLRKLENCLSDLMSHRHLVMKPDSSRTTWHGNRANTFKNIQKYSINGKYRNLEHQMKTVISLVRSKIHSLDSQIDSLFRQIEMEKERLKRINH